MQPIECEAQFQTLQFQPLSRIPIGETFVAVVTVTNLSPFAMILEQGAWKFDCSHLTSQSMMSQLSGKTLKSEEKGNDVVVLLLAENANKKIEPGFYSLKWKRYLCFFPT